MCSHIKIARLWRATTAPITTRRLPGSPFRPLYDDRIWFSFQPIALVVAEEPEVARFAASLVRVEYAEEAHVTDIHRQRDRAATVEPGSSHSAPPKPRGNAEAALAAAV